MKAESCVLLILLALSIECFLVGRAHGQSTETPSPVNPASTCSPAPCVLPPTEASEGGSVVIEPLIATNPLNQKELLLGSFDYNCLKPSYLGLHLSRDGGSTWTRVECMPIIIKKNSEWWPTFEPAVGFDRKGNAYAAAATRPARARVVSLGCKNPRMAVAGARRSSPCGVQARHLRLRLT